MIIPMRSYLTLILLQILLVWGTMPAFGQVDPTKVLVGTWDGWVEGGGERERTIIITKVTPKEGGGWTAEGQYGIYKSKLGRQTFDVSLQNGEVIVEFTTGAKNPGRLKLVGDNKLEGTLNFVVKRGSGDRGFKLEKVGPKAGDVK
jgi:hypothetical protein